MDEVRGRKEGALVLSPSQEEACTESATGPVWQLVLLEWEALKDDAIS